MDKDNSRMETNDRFSKSVLTKTRWRDEIVKFAGMNCIIMWLLNYLRAFKTPPNDSAYSIFINL